MEVPESSTSGGTLPRPPPPPPPPGSLGKCSSCSGAGRLPSDLAPSPRSPPQPRPGGGGSDAPRQGRDLGRRHGAARSSGARGRACRALVALQRWSAPGRPLIRGARATGQRNRGLAADVTHPFVGSFNVTALRAVWASGGQKTGQIDRRLFPQREAKHRNSQVGSRKFSSKTLARILVPKFCISRRPFLYTPIVLGKLKKRIWRGSGRGRMVSECLALAVDLPIGSLEE